MFDNSPSMRLNPGDARSKPARTATFGQPQMAGFVPTRTSSAELDRELWPRAFSKAQSPTSRSS